MAALNVCTICARGGSKGVPGKNTRIIAGKPLINFSIEQALATGLFSEIAVSSDSQHILDTAAKAGATILISRPDELATDNAPKIPVIQNCFRTAEEVSGKTFDYVVDLDVTSPLRSPQDIVDAYQLLLATGAENVITGAPARRSPYFNLVEAAVDGTVRLSKPQDKAIVRRQDAPKCYDMNASIYLWRRQVLLEATSVFGPSTRLYEMPEERSIDIDSQLDFELVEFLMSRAQTAR